MNIFDCLTNKERKSLKQVTLKKDEILFHEEERCEKVGIVIKGLLNIVSYSLSGTEIVYNVLKEGQMFGNNLLFSSRPYYKGSVIAKEKSVVVLIDKISLLTLFNTNQEFLVRYLSFNSDFSISLNQQIKLLSLNNAEERLLYFLKDKKVVEIESVSSLAKSLFLSREATSRLLTKMMKDGKIIRKGNIIELLK